MKFQHELLGHVINVQCYIAGNGTLPSASRNKSADFLINAVKDGTLLLSKDRPLLRLLQLHNKQKSTIFLPAHSVNRKKLPSNQTGQIALANLALPMTLTLTYDLDLQSPAGYGHNLLTCKSSCLLYTSDAADE